MPVQRTFWSALERVDDVDLNRLSALPLANLVLAMRHFLAPSLGIFRGGKVTPAGGMFCNLTPFAALAPNGAGAGLVIIEDARVVGPFTAGGSERIDMVSVRYVETPETESREFINDTTDTEYTDNAAQVLITSTPTIVITPGVSEAPAGDIAIATVRTVPGQTVITDEDITPAYQDRVHPLQMQTALGLVGDLPWISPTLVHQRQRGLFSSLFIGSIEIDCSNMPELVALRAEIWNGDIAIGTAVGLTPPNAAAHRLITITAIGFDGQPDDPVREYSFRLLREDGNAFANASITRVTLASLTLGSINTGVS